MMLTGQAKLILKTAEFSKDFDKSNFCGMVEIKKPNWSKFKKEQKRD